MGEAERPLRQRLNDDRRRRFGQPGRVLALLCECGNADCQKTVLLSSEEYDARRGEPILHPSHAGDVTPGVAPSPPPDTETPAA